MSSIRRLFELMLFYSHLLPLIAVPSIFMQMLMTYSIRMLDKKMMLVSMISTSIDRQPFIGVKAVMNSHIHQFSYIFNLDKIVEKEESSPAK